MTPTMPFDERNEEHAGKLAARLGLAEFQIVAFAPVLGGFELNGVWVKRTGLTVAWSFRDAAGQRYGVCADAGKPRAEVSLVELAELRRHICQNAVQTMLSLVVQP